MQRAQDEYQRAAQSQRQETDDALQHAQDEYQRAAQSQRQETDDALQRAQDEYQRAAQSQRQETDDAQSQRHTLAEEHASALADSIAANRRERDEQRSAYEQIREQTVTSLNAELGQALEDSARNYQSAMTEATENLNAEQQRNTDVAIAGINTRWTKFTRILVGVTAASSATAIAAILVALLI